MAGRFAWFAEFYPIYRLLGDGVMYRDMLIGRIPL